MNSKYNSYNYNRDILDQIESDHEEDKGNETDFYPNYLIIEKE